MSYIVNASAPLAGPEIIVKASSLEEARRIGVAKPDFPASGLPFSLEDAEWSFMDAVEDEAYIGEGEYELVPYASVDVHIDNNGENFNTKEEAEAAADEFVENYHPELELPSDWSEAGFVLSDWDNVFIYAEDGNSGTFVPA